MARPSKALLWAGAAAGVLVALWACACAWNTILMTFIPASSRRFRADREASVLLSVCSYVIYLHIVVEHLELGTLGTF
jgi:hypothetical protein